MKDSMFGKRLKALLDEKDISQRGLADNLGVTETTISRYVTAARVPRWKTLCRIADALGVTTDALMEGKPAVSVGYEPSTPEKVIRLGPYEYGRCPGCHSALDTLANPNYCGHCGRQVKWE